MTAPGMNIMSQKQYLQKYLSKNKKRKKKDKISSSSLVKRSQIIDDDDDDLIVKGNIDDDEYSFDYLGDEAPQIAGIVDERPLEVRSRDHYNEDTWKDVGKSEEPDHLSKSSTVFQSSLESSKFKEDKYHQRKSGTDAEISSLRINHRTKNDDSDHSPIRTSAPEKWKKKKTVTDSDLSPLRVSNSEVSSKKPKLLRDTGIERKRKNRSDSDTSPPRIRNQIRTNRKYDSDESPPRSTKKGVERSRKRSGSDSDMSPIREPCKSASRNVDRTHIDMRKNKSYDNKSNVNVSSSKLKKKQSIKSDENSDSDMSPSRSTKADKYYKDKRECSSSEKRSESKSVLKDKAYSRKEKYSRDSINEKKQNSDSDLSPPRTKDKTLSRRYELKNIKSGSDFSHKSSKRDEERYENNSHDMFSSKSGKSDSKKNKTQKNRVSSSEYDRNDVGNNHSKNIRSHSHESSKDTLKLSKNKSDLVVDVKRTKLISKHPEKDKYSNRKPSDSHRLKKDSESNTKTEKMEQTLDGKRAGLQNAGNLKEELINLKQKEEQMFRELATNLSGEGAAPVMRDRKTGKKRDLEKEKEESIINSAKQAEKNEKYFKWGKGLKQVEDSEKRISDTLHEMSKPLARYASDEDLENFLKAQEREGDPMLDYIRQKQAESINVNEPSEFSKCKPKYRGSFMPNRFGIPPGYRWDGVDRSNGYEQSWFEHRNAKKAVEEEAYKWSTSDM